VSSEIIDWQAVAIDGETNLKRPAYMYKELEFEVRPEEVKSEELKLCTQYL